MSDTLPPRRARDGSGADIPPMTLGNMRALGIRRIDAYCEAPQCWHSAVVDVDHLPDDLPVPNVALRLRCSACGSKRVQTRPDWARSTAAGTGRRQD